MIPTAFANSIRLSRFDRISSQRTAASVTSGIGTCFVLVSNDKVGQDVQVLLGPLIPLLSQ